MISGWAADPLQGGSALFVADTKYHLLPAVISSISHSWTRCDGGVAQVETVASIARGSSVRTSKRRLLISVHEIDAVEIVHSLIERIAVHPAKRHSSWNCQAGGRDRDGALSGNRKSRPLSGTAFLIWLRGQDLNLRPSGYEPDELPGCSTPRQIHAQNLKSRRRLLRPHRKRFRAFGRPGSDLLSRALRHSTIGAESFHGRVRNGIGCSPFATATRSSKRAEVLKSRAQKPCADVDRCTERMKSSRSSY